MSGGYISKITFNNNQSVEINANDIVVFVGANREKSNIKRYI